MKSLFKIVGGLLLLVICAVLLVAYNPDLQIRILNLLGPDHSFTESKPPAPLDYALPASWLALPTAQNNAMWAPAGHAAIASDEARAYVFFIHPTAYLANDHWNGSMDKTTGTEENKQWMMANLASAYNGCCSIYAPYFREATIHAFLQSDLSEGAKALDFAYQDVARAFQQFLRMIPAGSPFIVASHSQGTVHGQRLLQQEIDDTPLAQRMVAAYLVGCTIHEDLFSSQYKTIKACEGPDDLNCVNAWDTWEYGTEILGPDCPNWTGDSYVRTHKKWLCVNPLTWKQDAQPIAKDKNSGTVAIQNRYNIYFFGESKAQGLTWGPLEAPVTGIASAQCENGVLRTNDQSGGMFDQMVLGGNYHGLDYALYYMSIRDNSQRRVDAWLAKHAR